MKRNTLWRPVLGVVFLSVLWAASAGAQSYSAFARRTSVDVTVPAFSDQGVTTLLGTLDRLLAAPDAEASWHEHAEDALWQFARRLQTGRLSPAQETKVLAHLDSIARSRPDAAAVVRGPRRMVSTLTVGKAAPNISGIDLDGRPFKLSDFRGKVVLLRFSAEWCAICKVQAPYERFLLDRYARWPFALLGVETGSSREAARQAQAKGPLSHRAWWDEPSDGEQGGPIASAWNVVGWPATYLIDGDGIIQFVDLREEDLLIAVRQLVEAQVDVDAKRRK